MLRERISYRKAIYRALDHVLGSDEKVVFMGEDISEYGGAFGVSADLYRRYPSRVISTPISEGSVAGAAVGLSMTGYRVIVEIMFMDFITLAMDQIINHAANIHYMYGGQVSCPIVIRTPAGGYRGYGPSHSKTLEGLFLGIPGLKIVAPSTVQDAWGALLSAVYDNNPVLFIEHKLLYDMEDEINLDHKPGPIGRARIVREGADVTVVSHSYGSHLSMRAAQELSAQGIEAEVIDLVSLKPLDIDTVASSVKKTGRLVTVEEGDLSGGVGAEVVSRVAEDCLPYIDGRIIRVGKPDVPIPASITAESHVLPGIEAVIEAAKKTLSWK
ncbi:MAG: alpha-ketoacid dehydrogenase subunit beta [Deltaproteobacteria bacterium]